MHFERSAFSSIHPEVASLFSHDGGAVISRMMTSPMIWENPRIDLDTHIIDEDVVWHIQRGGVDKIPYNYVLCHLFIDTEDGPSKRGYQISVGREQPIFSIRDTRICTIPLEQGWTVTYTAMFDEDHVSSTTALPARITASDGSAPTFYSALLIGDNGKARYNLFSQERGVYVSTLSDLHVPSRRASDAEIEVFSLGYSCVGYRDPTVLDVAIRGSDRTNWPQWKNPFA